MPVFSSKMTLFGKAGLYTIIGMVSWQRFSGVQQKSFDKLLKRKIN